MNPNQPSKGWVTAIAWGLLASTAALAAPPDPLPVARPDLAAAHRTLLRQWQHQGDPLSLDLPETQALVQQGWTLVQAWACAYLDQHPHAQPAELAKSFAHLLPPECRRNPIGSPLEAAVLRLAPNTLLVSATYQVGEGAAETLFILNQTPDGRNRVAWNLLDLAKAHFPSGDELGRWAYFCDMRYYAGSLLGTPRSLPPAGNGHPRFSLLASQCAHGATALLQASVWEWDGQNAVPLCIQSFRRGVQDSFGSTRNGRYLRFGTREESATFSCYGGGEEPRGTWTLRLDPDGVKDLGHRWREPNAQLLDAVCTRLREGEDASDIASPEAIAWLRQTFQTEPGPNPKPDPGYFLGTYGSSRTRHDKHGDRFQLSCDQGMFLFTIVRRAGHRYLLRCR